MGKTRLLDKRDWHFSLGLSTLLVVQGFTHTLVMSRCLWGVVWVFLLLILIFKPSFSQSIVIFRHCLAYSSKFVSAFLIRVSSIAFENLIQFLPGLMSNLEINSHFVILPLLKVAFTSYTPSSNVDLITNIDLGIRAHITLFSDWHGFWVDPCKHLRRWSGFCGRLSTQRSFSLEFQC